MKKSESTPATAPKSEKTKEVLPTRASVLDEIIKAGGTWQEMTEKADQAAAPLKTKIKHYTVALLKTHIRYRISKRPNYFTGLVIKDEGVFLK